MSAGSTWAGSHDYLAREVLSPTTVDEVAEIVAREPQVRALGSRHSFTDVADSAGVLVSLAALDTAPELVGDTVRVPGGMLYGDLALWLHERGRALASMASLPHISVAGAVATGTHGSGVRNGSLAAAVSAVELVDGRGQVVRIARGDADFDGAVVAVGALGIVTVVELDTVEAYDVSQAVHEGLTWQRLLEDPWRLLASAYSVSVFTRWTGEEVGQVWTKERGSVPAIIDGLTPAAEQRHMIPGMDASLTTPQLGEPGPWHERIPHFRHGFLPSSGDELQTEYLVPRAQAARALAGVRQLADEIEPLLHVTELRTIAADQLWLSGAYDTDALAIHFTWLKRPAQVAALLPRLEVRLLPLGARPHWGKVFDATAPQLGPLYPRMTDFLQLAARFDPSGRFVNAWTARVFGGQSDGGA
ncbi:D-arabinono-1,4-lactone oxidase [Nocardioides sp. Kera G14]|uniref:D-arabinono-1,4-lactone oxidase n=1 Tax=Nocardioides sp. Kera G14 TaxID=2884264 RepID=UPI001D0F9754|nr:D-arabinono-1,4-lactone oxidase [Nocardioides sp. Kera G14]UDY24956.1 FAD-binding protein [Nocardioides sp. Kera G14]